MKGKLFLNCGWFCNDNFFLSLYICVYIILSSICSKYKVALRIVLLLFWFCLCCSQGGMYLINLKLPLYSKTSYEIKLKYLGGKILHFAFIYNLPLFCVIPTHFNYIIIHSTSWQILQIGE